MFSFNTRDLFDCNCTIYLESGYIVQHWELYGWGNCDLESYGCFYVFSVYWKKDLTVTCLRSIFLRWDGEGSSVNSCSFAVSEGSRFLLHYLLHPCPLTLLRPRPMQLVQGL